MKEEKTQETHIRLPYEPAEMKIAYIVPRRLCQSSVEEEGGLTIGSYKNETFTP